MRNYAYCWEQVKFLHFLFLGASRKENISINDEFRLGVKYNLLRPCKAVLSPFEQTGKGQQTILHCFSN